MYNVANPEIVGAGREEKREDGTTKTRLRKEDEKE
jgi:hypothetical protein